MAPKNLLAEGGGETCGFSFTKEEDHAVSGSKRKGEVRLKKVPGGSKVKGGKGRDGPETKGPCKRTGKVAGLIPLNKKQKEAFIKAAGCR